MEYAKIIRLDVWVKDWKERERAGGKTEISRMRSGARDHTRMTARSKARRMTMRIMMHQPDFVSSVSRINLRIRFMASSNLAPERSTPCSMSSSILVQYIRPA